MKISCGPSDRLPIAFTPATMVSSASSSSSVPRKSHAFVANLVASAWAALKASACSRPTVESQFGSHGPIVKTSLVAPSFHPGTPTGRGLSVRSRNVPSLRGGPSINEKTVPMPMITFGSPNSGFSQSPGPVAAITHTLPPRRSDVTYVNRESVVVRSSG